MGSSLGCLRWQQDIGHRDLNPVTGSRETPGSASTSISSGHNGGARVGCEQTEGCSISPCGGATPMLGTTDVNTGLYSSEKTNQQFEAPGLAAAAAEGTRQLPEELSACSSLQVHSASCNATDSTAAKSYIADIGRLVETSSYEAASGADSRQGTLAIDAAAHATDVPAQLEAAAVVAATAKAGSDMAVLRDLKVGPMLGRPRFGTYSRVYKGRWKAVTIALKVIEHNERASSAGMDPGRESLLATSFAHPNVVPTYHTSTMTVSQRNALAYSWLQEGATSSSNGTVPVLQSTADDDLANVERLGARARRCGSCGSSHRSLAEQEDVLETWMLMEYCEKGSLHRAVKQGRFVGQDGRLDMIGIYKALLDTAQGLDYLHSIGVIHGDLKAANVLLKGSSRHVRGFTCKITEFAFSRVLDLNTTRISTQTYGTLVYMPSELLLDSQMTKATDIYSFGLMMWELYSSTGVFNTEVDEGLSTVQIYCMIAYQRWRPAIPPDCPTGFAALMAACWNQNPEQRPTAQQLLRSLQSLYMAEKKAMAAARDGGDQSSSALRISP